MKDAITFLSNFFTDLGFGNLLATSTARILIILAVLILAALANFIAKRIIVRLLNTLTSRSRNTWDDIFREQKVFERLSHLAPGLILYFSAPLVFPNEPGLSETVHRITLCYMIVVVSFVVNATLNAGLIIYQRFEVSRQHPIKAYVQVVAIFLFIITGILVISTLLDKSPWALLSGLGAMTAILMLVFRDSILGFVASIQLIANQMVQIGDWIEMPKYGADGDVIDVSLTTIKVQNWDKTITTIPTYSLISDSFKNWRGMSQSGGRRIKRSIRIDMNSIQFCDQQMLERFRKIDLIRSYIEGKESEVLSFNTERKVDTSVPINGRRLTNIGCFRAYICEYLRSSSHINQEMTLLVRHLQPTETGLPIEIYAFSSDKRWAEYENIQADIFDHIFAALDYFDLKVFQNPSGSDFSSLANSS